jgi:hypothetical protein
MGSVTLTSEAVTLYCKVHNKGQGRSSAGKVLGTAGIKVRGLAVSGAEERERRGKGGKGEEGRERGWR